MRGTVPPTPAPLRCPSVTLPDPYRGYAQPTWDTKTLAALIAVLGGVGNPPSVGGGGGGFAAATFIDVYMSAGGGVSIQSLFTGTFTTLNLDTETSDVNNRFDTGTHFYTVPTTGLYACSALVRTRDNQWNNVSGDNLGIGIRAQWEPNAGPSFKWDKVQTTAAGGGRFTTDHYRVAQFSAGDTLQLYAYQDSGSTRDLYSAAMQIYRVG